MPLEFSEIAGAAEELNARREQRRKDKERKTFEESRLELLLILEWARLRFADQEEPANAIVHGLVMRLHEFRNACYPAIWRELLPEAQRHSLGDYLLQDPFTRRSFDKPRGYSGDGVLLDLAYRHPSIEPRVAESSLLGQDIYAYTSISSSAVAVRERRDLLGEWVDETAARVRTPEILAIAGGHLRESEKSVALAEGRVGRWLSVDQDPANLAVVAEDYAGTAIETLAGSVKGLVAGTHDIGQFDFAYSAGVYDYLPDEAAVLLTRQILARLKPGGSFVFGNFSTEVIPDGYMETFMNWQLMMRTEAQMRALAEASVKGQDAQAEVFFGRNRHIVYARITRKS